MKSGSGVRIRRLDCCPATAASMASDERESCWVGRDGGGERESGGPLRMVGVTSTSQRSKSSGVDGGGVDVFFWKDGPRPGRPGSCHQGQAPEDRWCQSNASILQRFFPARGPYSSVIIDL
jgi:hypothetical protein